MPSLIPGYNYDIFISYRQKKKEGVRARRREEENRSFIYRWLQPTDIRVTLNFRALAQYFIWSIFLNYSNFIIKRI